MRENKDIIAKSRAQVGEGVQLIGRAGGEVEEIIEPVKSFSRLISDITSATQEQATTLGLGGIGQSRHSDIACGEEYRYGPSENKADAFHDIGASGRI